MKLFLKLPKITVAICCCMYALFQHSVVGSTLHSKSFSVELFFADSDTSKIKTDSIAVSIDTTAGDDLKSKIKYQAKDSIISDIQNEIVYLYDSATIDYEDLHMQANFIKIDFNAKEIYAQGTTDSSGNLIGKPEFSQGAQKFKSNEIRYNFDSKKGKLSYVVTQEGEGFIHGETVKKSPDNNFYIHNGQFTTCDADTPHFSIFAKKLKVISNNKIVTGPANLHIEGIPTPLFIPFGFFPNKKGRSSGLIFPSYGESAQRGFYLQHLGYYLGLNDYVNFALTSDIYTKGSLTLDLNSTYAKRYGYRGNFKLSRNTTVVSEKELPDYSVQNDYHVYWSHSQDAKANPYHTFNASVNAGTSTYYRNIVTSANNFLANTFQSSVSYNKIFPDQPYNLGIAMNHSQNTLTKDIHVGLPDVSFGVSRINPFGSKKQVGAKKWYQNIGASYSMRATNYIDTKDTLLFRQESFDEMKNGISHTVPIATSIKMFKYFSLSPSVSLNNKTYFKTTRYDWNAEENKIDTTTVRGFQNAFDYAFSTGLTTRIYGMYQFKKGKIAAIRHVMSPNISVGYRPDFGLAKYGYYKNVQTDSLGTLLAYSIYSGTVYGGPSNGKYGNIGFGLDNNIEMKVRVNSDTGSTLKKIQLFESLRISGGYNLIADSMKLSTFAVGARTKLFDKVDITFGGILDPYTFDSLNRDYNKFQYDVDGKLARFTSGNIALNFSLNSKKKEKTSEKYSAEELDYINKHPEEYVDFDVPANLSLSYVLSYSQRGNLPATRTQSVSANGDINLTPKWKVGFNSWYDFSSRSFTNFGINIFRDLHCWEIRFNWIPFGFQESYYFQINVKSSILQDLKLMKKNDFLDR